MAPRRVRVDTLLPWLVGAALLAAVVGATLHFADERAFVDLVERSEPWWLALAVLLQAATYVAQGAIWRAVVLTCGAALAWPTALTLSLAKLFVDQAVPSGGLSSSVLVAKALEKRGLPPPAVHASILVNIASYHLAYAAALAVALAVLVRHQDASMPVLAAAGVFLAFCAGMSGAVLALAGRPHPRLAAVRRVPLAGPMLDVLERADGALVRSARLEAVAGAWQAGIVLLDAATMWTLIAALGVRGSAGGVFASFMVASLFRTMGIVPGGLGTFEATSVLTLRIAGVDLATALSATLLFRGLSFWLPMAPGYWCSRRAVAPREPAVRVSAPARYWTMEPDAALERLGSSRAGLSSQEAQQRRAAFGPNTLKARRHLTWLDVVWRQLESPLLLLLVVAAIAAALTGEWLDAGIVVTIVVVTVGIGAWREYSAEDAAAALRARLHGRCAVLRDGAVATLPSDELVPGDLVLLSAGLLVPADALLVDATDFFVSEAVLTGESYPVQKGPGALPAEAEIRDRANCVFLGTNVRSGSARAVVVATGQATEFGAIARRLTLGPGATAFDRGLRRFGNLLTLSMVVMVMVVFTVHALSGRSTVETLLFAVALAVGLSPELLPAILTVNLAHGAQVMAGRGVLVRRLNAIENLGSMDVLCTDKTGTLTEGVVQVEGAYDASGAASPRVLELASWNAALETGIASPLDDAITAAHAPDLSRVRKLGEVPFDFVRKRVTVVVASEDGVRLVTKGAFAQVAAACATRADGRPLDAPARAELARLYEGWTARGTRVVALATRAIDARPAYTRDDERDLVFEGFVTFLDRPKAGVREAVGGLAALGVAVKVITGDSRLVAEHVAGLVGLGTARVVTGRQLDELHDEALWREAERTDIFAEVDPNQKERIILALRKMGHVVGFLGDGVNDAPAMHAADTSLSVDEAVDVARDAADFVLLERGLDVIRRGIEEGRRTFANTLKYVLTTTSANLGNMTSMAAASLVLPFLPLTAGQILLNNLLSDIPAFGLAGDRVDAELVAAPRQWDVRFIGRYMVAFGLVSALFDVMTFGVLLLVFRAPPDIFRTAWFVESLLTELAVALLMRTRRPCYRSRPGTGLLVSTAVLAPVAVLLPYAPAARLFGFVPLPGAILAVVGGITALYVVTTEVQKAWFYATPQRPTTTRVT
ncbi:MAG: magnesium-translocating P-type ATPase [Vicinamibacterales bacterium]